MPPESQSISPDHNSLTQALTTVRDFLRWCVTRLNEADVYLGHGTHESWDEAVALVVHVLHMDPDVDSRILDAKLIRAEKEAILHCLDMRIESRLPLPYITHKAWLAGVPFYVDQRVIVPRSPIAQLIESGLAPWLADEVVNGSQPVHMLDMCTGSGCLAVLAALAFEHAQVDAVDISDAALQVAAKNVADLKVSDQVNLIQSDLFSNLGDAKAYDLIIANPPYVTPAEMDGVPLEYSHEPTLALVDEAAGIGLATQIINQAARFLKPHGILVLEVGNSWPNLETAFAHIEFLWLECSSAAHGVCLLRRSQLPFA